MFGENGCGKTKLIEDVFKDKIDYIRFTVSHLINIQDFFNVLKEYYSSIFEEFEQFEKFKELIDFRKFSDLHDFLLDFNQFLLQLYIVK